MAFAVKDWKDGPDASTPITASSLEDLEARLASYTDSQVGGVSGGITAAVSPAASGAANKAAINSAIDTAVGLGGGAVHIPAGTYQLDCPLSRTVNDITIYGDGPGITTLVLTRTNTVPVKEGIRLIGDNLTVRDLEVREGNPAATQGAHLVNPGLVGIRVGGVGQTTPLYGKNITVENCLMTSILGQAIVLYYCENARAVGNRITDCGEGIAGENCRRGELVIDGNTVDKSADDLIVIKAATDWGATESLQAIVTNNHVSNGSAKGLGLAGTYNVVCTNNTVDNCATYGIASWKNPGAANLLPAHHVVIANNQVNNAGQYYGADPAQYYYSAVQSSTCGILIETGDQTTVVNNQVYNSAKQGIAAVTNPSVDVAIDHNHVQSAGGVGIALGNPDGTDPTRYTDCRIHGNRVRNTIGGIVCGEATNLQVTDNNVRSYKSGASGSRRGIQIGRCDRFDVRNNHVTNDDGGDQLYYTYNGCTNELAADNRFT